MQELQFVQDDSDPSSLVLRAVDGEQEFFLAVTDELTEFLDIAVELSAQDAPSDTGTTTKVSAATDQAAQDAAAAVSAGSADNTGSAGSAGSAGVVEDGNDSDGEDVAVEAHGDRPAGDALSATSTPAENVPHKERIHLRPREIQDRIRHGETVEQIIAATGMEERRVRPYAAPIDMERARIAELARDAYPVRSDGPADQPLREVLATAFGARGESLRASTWTAAMDNSDHWVVSVSWAKGNRPGGTRFIADFRYIPADQDPATAVPVNSVASDLIDPRFERPVRTVSPLIPASRQDSGEEPYGDDDPGAAAAEAAAAAGWGEPAPSQDDPGNYADADTNTGAGGDTAADPAADDQANAPVDLFGDRTDRADHAEDGRPRRKKQAVTPHWEDVLLGVRTNPRANGRNRKK